MAKASQLLGPNVSSTQSLINFAHASIVKMNELFTQLYRLKLPQDTSLTQVTFVWICYFVITSYFWSQGFLRKPSCQSFCVLTLGINRSSHILAPVTTLQCKIFHVNMISLLALPSKKVVQITSNWSVLNYFQTVELSTPWLNFLDLEKHTTYKFYQVTGIHEGWVHKIYCFVFRLVDKTY